MAQELPFLFTGINGRSVIRDMVQKGVIIVDTDKKHSKALCSVLESADYEPLSVGSLSEAMANLETKLYGALLIDLDHASPDNRHLKELRQAHPRLCLIGLSHRSFHPELEEALSRYIDACFTKSAEYEDLLYWLRAVFDPSIHKGRENEGSEGESRERS
jgi:DNA-binding response OmpR family regulator